jgi:hypothetical protein
LELARQARNGRTTPCSQQIFLEARWLTFFSAHFERIEQRLIELREMLARSADPHDAREQIESDGSFDHCSEAWFLKLDATVEELDDRASRGEKPRYPLKLLDRINAPARLREYLDSRLVSDVTRTGIDNRYVLNIGISAIVRLLTGDLGNVYPFPRDMKQALFDYMDNHWQDPETGFYGGWYRLPDGGIRKTADLSVTFHIVSYRRDSTKRLPEMMRTLLAMEKYEFPFRYRVEQGVAAAEAHRTRKSIDRRRLDRQQSGSARPGRIRWDEVAAV